jgi:hypothetical protein
MVISDLRSAARELAIISADIHRADGNIEALLAIAARLSMLGSSITSACERAFVASLASSAA